MVERVQQRLCPRCLFEGFMIRHIFKYPLDFPDNAGDIMEVQMPGKPTICDINFQGDQIFIWAMIDTHAPLETYKFVVQGTGWRIHDVEGLCFVKTVHIPSGLVWHVFAVMDKV